MSPGTDPAGSAPRQYYTPWTREEAQLPTPTIATRTEPIRLSPRRLHCSLKLDPWLDPCLVSRVGRGRRCRRPRIRPGVLLVVPALGVDQLREPPDLPLDGLHAVPLELHGVAVHLPLGALELVLHPVEALLQAAATPFQDAQPRLDVRAAEEREPYVEGVVLPGCRPHVGHQALEPLVTGRGELVDDPLPAADGSRLRRADVLGDPAGLEHLLQRRVERPVGQ